MRLWKAALLITGLLMLSAAIGLAQEKASAPCPPSCAQTCTVAVGPSCDGAKKQIKVEITDDGPGRLIKVWEVKDGEDVLIKEIKSADKAAAMAELHELEGVDGLHMMVMDDDGTFDISRDPDGRQIRKIVRQGRSPHIGFFSGPQAWLGVAMKDLNPQLAEYFQVEDDQGTLIEEVVEGSPAGKSGLKAGDVILKIGETEVARAGDVIKAVSEAGIGDTLKIEVKRKGKKKTFEVELGEREAESFAWNDAGGDGGGNWTMKDPNALNRFKTMHPGTGHDILIKEMRGEDLSGKVEALRADVEELKAVIEDLRNERK